MLLLHIAKALAFGNSELTILYMQMACKQLGRALRKFI